VVINEDVEFSSPKPSSAFVSENDLREDEDEDGSTPPSPRQAQHSFYIKHSPRNNENEEDHHGLDLLGSVITSDLPLSRPPPLTLCPNTSRMCNFTNTARSSSSISTVSLGLAPAQCSTHPPLLPTSLPPNHPGNNNKSSNSNGGAINSTTNNNNINGAITTTVSTNGGSLQSINGVQPPMNLSFPRIPHSPDSALGGWSTPSSNLSRHNSDASQRSFSSSSNNTTPPSPSNSPLLTHNQNRIKVEDFGKNHIFCKKWNKSSRIYTYSQDTFNLHFETLKSPSRVVSSHKEASKGFRGVSKSKQPFSNICSIFFCFLFKLPSFAIVLRW